jgi:hypothetical protein
MRKTGPILSVVLLVLSLSACAPEVGSEKWCEGMDDKPKGDWTANEAKAYAKYCVFGNYVDDED